MGWRMLRVAWFLAMPLWMAGIAVVPILYVLFGIGFDEYVVALFSLDERLERKAGGR